MVNGLKPFTLLAKLYPLIAWQGSEYASADSWAYNALMFPHELHSNSHYINSTVLFYRQHQKYLQPNWLSRLWYWSHKTLWFQYCTSRWGSLIDFKRQSHKMVQHTQTIRRQFVDELFECVWPFCEIGAKRVNPWTLQGFSFFEIKKVGWPSSGNQALKV